MTPTSPQAARIARPTEAGSRRSTRAPSGYGRRMPDSEPAAVTRFKEAHVARGGGGRIVILPDRVHTAALAAEALGCAVGAIANSLIFDTGGSPALILTSGAHRVDTA